MKSFTYVVHDKEGIHARPAGIIVAEAKKFTSNIVIKNKGKQADIKRIFGVMGLCVKGGETIVVEATGADEDAAIAALETAIKGNL